MAETVATVTSERKNFFGRGRYQRDAKDLFSFAAQELRDLDVQDRGQPNHRRDGHVLASAFDAAHIVWFAVETLGKLSLRPPLHSSEVSNAPPEPKER
jgi:hypothetical protein